VWGSDAIARRAVRYVFFAIPLSSIPAGFAPATALFRDRLHVGLLPSEILYFAATVGAIFVFNKIASKVEDRLFERQAVEVPAK
jgi:hypothetical protein